MTKRVAIVGGCGHVGLPLGLALAHKGFSVTLLDQNKEAVEAFNNKQLLFQEMGAEELLVKHAGKNIVATMRPQSLLENDIVIFVTGTSENGQQEVMSVVGDVVEFMNSEQLIILRSTLSPGTTEMVDRVLQQIWGRAKVAYCPERMAQGLGIQEIFNLPQIISGTTAVAISEAQEFFSLLVPKTILLEPKEAELAKLMTNAWRYMEFAIANQFYMTVESQGVDFYKIFGAISDDYPRAAHFARPGLAAGPCLRKDTAQLSNFQTDPFFFGPTATVINESLPRFLVEQLKKKMKSLKNKKIAILGMTFKANCDDTRDSLSLKIKKILEQEQAIALPSDVYLKETFPLSQALDEADGVILGVPHREYLDLQIKKPFVDCWNVWEQSPTQQNYESATFFPVPN